MVLYKNKISLLNNGVNHFMKKIINTVTTAFSDTKQTMKDQVDKMSENKFLKSKENYAPVVSNEEDKFISISFDAWNQKIMEIGEKMNDIVEQAYMNWYNWEAVFTFYFDQIHPEYSDLETDSEAEMYVITFEYSQENLKKAKKVSSLMNSFINNDRYIYKMLEEYWEDIEWD